MDYAAARKHMLESQVRTNDLPNLRVQEAMGRIPREVFLPSELRNQAYVERELAYAPGRRMLIARDFAKLVDAADPRPQDVVLDIACGSGYSTAILACLAEMVVGLESDEALAGLAQDNLSSLDITNAAVITGDLKAGAAKQGPFDLIFIGGVTPAVPEALFAQLKEGGRLATILRSGGVPRGVVCVKGAAGAVAPRYVFDACARTDLPEFALPKTFVF